ncbi:MAG: UDP-N-acetylglucosamine pyrophosphorylase [bacterium]|nr:UDP-N-acetylglucosamine pyrophosphorylase [bacterium]
MRQEEMKVSSLFDTSHSIVGRVLSQFTYPWEILPRIEELIVALGQVLPDSDYKKFGDSIWVHKSVKVAPSVAMGKNIIVCQGAELRHCAYIRGNAIIGAGAVVGNSTELKNVILFDGVQVPHYNYVGDSILGFKAHLGAGAITSNVRADKELVKVHAEDGDLETGLKKFGAIVGDNVEVGCNSVLNPGTIIGRGSNVYPLSSVRGCVDANSIYKKQGEVVEKNK